MTSLDMRPANLRPFRTGFAVLALVALAVPLLAMQFGSGVDWGPGDFLVAGGLLLALYAGIEIAIRAAPNARWRIAGIAISSLVFLAVWIELAVGIFA